MTPLTQAEQAAYNKFLNAQLGWDAIQLDDYWVADCYGHNDGIRYMTESDAYQSMTDFFTNSDASYGALHRVTGMLSPEQWAVYTKEICKVFEDRALVNIMNASIRSGEFPDVAATYATVAGAMMVPCSTCAPILARVLGYVAQEVQDG